VWVVGGGGVVVVHEMGCGARGGVAASGRAGSGDERCGARAAAAGGL
jgi:hypothetical protein